MNTISKWIRDTRQEHGSIRCWLFRHRWTFEEFGGGYCNRCYKPTEVSSNIPRISERISDKIVYTKWNIRIVMRRWLDLCPDCDRPYHKILWMKWDHRDCIPF